MIIARGGEELKTSGEMKSKWLQEQEQVLQHQITHFSSIHNTAQVGFVGEKAVATQQ